MKLSSILLSVVLLHFTQAVLVVIPTRKPLTQPSWTQDSDYSPTTQSPSLPHMVQPDHPGYVTARFAPPEQWASHVGPMLASGRLIHSNAHSAETAAAPSFKHALSSLFARLVQPTPVPVSSDDEQAGHYHGQGGMQPLHARNDPLGDSDAGPPTGSLAGVTGTSSPLGSILSTGAASEATSTGSTDGSNSGTTINTAGPAHTTAADASGGPGGHGHGDHHGHHGGRMYGPGPWEHFSHNNHTNCTDGQSPHGHGAHAFANKGLGAVAPEGGNNLPNLGASPSYGAGDAGISNPLGRSGTESGSSIPGDSDQGEAAASPASEVSTSISTAGSTTVQGTATGTSTVHVSLHSFASMASANKILDLDHCSYNAYDGFE